MFGGWGDTVTRVDPFADHVSRLGGAILRQGLVFVSVSIETKNFSAVPTSYWRGGIIMITCTL